MYLRHVGPSAIMTEVSTTQREAATKVYMYDL